MRNACKFKGLIFSRVLRDSSPRFVRWSVDSLVTLYFFYVFYSFTILLLPKCPGDLKYDPYPPARDWGSRVSGLVNLIPPRRLMKFVLCITPLDQLSSVAK